MSDDQGALPPLDEDDDIWADAGTTDVSPAPRRGPAAPPRRGGQPDPRRGPARPPRRNGPGRPGGADRSRPGDAGSVRTGDAHASASQAPIAGGPVPEDDGHDYVDLPHEGSFPRWLGVLLVLVLLAGVLFGGGYYWYDRQLDPPGSPGEVVSVEIPQGSSTSGIGSILDSNGIIANSMVFNFYASRKGAGRFEAGVYRLRKNSDLDLVLETMAKGPTSAAVSAETVRVSIPEGLTVAEIVAKVAEQVPRFGATRLQSLLDDGSITSSLRPDDQKSYEGLFFPATYEVGSTKTEKELLDQLAAEMGSRVDGLGVPAAKARIKATYGLDLSTYDLVIVASMIQSEAGNADEAPKIATVIYNRLQQDIALGIDAVDQYGATLAGDPVDFEDTGLPYNTRRKQGLPPTPISAPGDFALAAALDPASGPWRYYVLTEANSHSFVETSAEFDEAKQICVAKGLGCG